MRGPCPWQGQRDREGEIDRAERDGAVEAGVDRRRRGCAAADDRRPGHGRAVEVRQQNPLRLQGRRLQHRSPELHVRGGRVGRRDGRQRAADPRRRLPPLQGQADDVQLPHTRRQYVRRHCKCSRSRRYTPKPWQKVFLVDLL